MKRKRYTPEFKSQIVLEILKEEKTMSQIASEHGIHVNQLHKWKTQFLQEMPQIFHKQNKDKEKMKADYDKQLESLYAEVGKLTTQLSWVKKKIWHLPRLDGNAWRWLIGETLNSPSPNRLNYWESIVPVFTISLFSHHRKRLPLNTGLMRSIPNIRFMDHAGLY